jgi:hypothetical protein
MNKEQEREILERKALREWFKKAGLGNSIVELGSIEDGSLHSYSLSQQNQPTRNSQHQGTPLGIVVRVLNHLLTTHQQAKLGLVVD